MARADLINFLNRHIIGNKIGEAYGHEDEMRSTPDIACILIGREMQERGLIKKMQRSYHYQLQAWELQSLEPTELLETCPDSLIFECLEEGLSDYFEYEKMPKKRKVDDFDSYRIEKERKVIKKFRKFVKDFNAIDGLPFAIVKKEGFYIPQKID